MQPDRRREARYWSDDKAKVWTSADPILFCTMIELSRRGARLLFSGEVPRADNLLLISEGLGEVRHGNVRWRIGQTVGIEYVRDPDDLID